MKDLLLQAESVAITAGVSVMKIHFYLLLHPQWVVVIVMKDLVQLQGGDCRTHGQAKMSLLFLKSL